MLENRYYICFVIKIIGRFENNYTNEIGISLSLWNMIITSRGNIYDIEFGKIQNKISELYIERNASKWKSKDIQHKKAYGI